jgi:MFS family permease
MAVHIAPPERRGSANSTFLCAYDIGLGCGGGIAGVLISGMGYRAMFLLVSLATIFSVLIYLLWGRKHPSSFSYQKKRER